MVKVLLLWFFRKSWYTEPILILALMQKIGLEHEEVATYIQQLMYISACMHFINIYVYACMHGHDKIKILWLYL